MARKRKAPTESAAERRKAAEVSPEDIDRAKAAWKRDARPEARRLLDATVDPDPAEDADGNSAQG